MAVIAIVVAMTGGIVRDLLIGIPPQGFRDWRYIVAAASAGALCFVLERWLGRLQRTISVFDALGLSLFCVPGATTASIHGIAPLQAAILGMITGIGGGVLRDLLLGETPPTVLRRGLYAVPALIGAAVVAFAYAAGFTQGLFAVAGAAVCFAIWMVGDVFDVELPKPRDDADRS